MDYISTFDFRSRYVHPPTFIFEADFSISGCDVGLLRVLLFTVWTQRSAARRCGSQLSARSWESLRGVSLTKLQMRTAAFHRNMRATC